MEGEQGCSAGSRWVCKCCSVRPRALILVCKACSGCRVAACLGCVLSALHQCGKGILGKHQLIPSLGTVMMVGLSDPKGPFQPSSFYDGAAEATVDGGVEVGDG